MVESNVWKQPVLLTSGLYSSMYICGTCLHKHEHGITHTHTHSY